MEVGDQTVAPSPAAGADVPRSAARRGRRWLWAILSFLFLLGVVVSSVMMRSERNEAIAKAAAGARVQAQRSTSTLTGKQLRKPVTGSSYDRLAARFRKYAPSDATIVGVTIWSSKGRILFSLDESLVGKTPPETRSSISSIAKGSGSTRALDNTLQTFTPVSKAPDGPVAIVEVDQPLAVVEAQTGDGWSMLRLGSAVGLAVSLLLLALTFVPSRRLRPAPSAGDHEVVDEGAGKGAGEPDPAEEHPAEGLTPTYEEIFGLQHGVDRTVDQHEAPEGDPETFDGDPEGRAEDPETDDDPEVRAEDPETDGDPEGRQADPEAMKSIRQWDENYQDMVDEELKTQELMRQRREEFKARAEAAALRVKKQDAELQEATPTPE